MTPQEAIDYLYEKRAGCAFTSNRRLIDVCNLAISALEKQIPKKVVKENEKVMFKIICGRCPECDVAVYSTANRYCHYCGQALDWGDE